MPLLVLVLMLFSPSVLSALCPRVDWDKTAIVKKVNDGDTITLENGQLVRFIGINTPEINHRNSRKSAPYAQRAKELVERYLRVGDKVNLVFDKTRRDKYGRQLAYVYSKTGRNLAAILLKAGYGKQWVIGKNDRFWQCLQQAERSARISRRGVWSGFSPIYASKITPDDKGYQYIRGLISQVKKTKKGLQFYLDRKLKVLISAARLRKFTANNIDFRNNDRLILTGKVRFSGEQAQLTLYHPVQILP